MSKALVLLSGGQDSTTCLFWAKSQFTSVIGLTFDYGQRHSLELRAAEFIAAKAGIECIRINIGSILQGNSPLVNKEHAVGEYASIDALPSGIEPTFVPARNILFLTIAANQAFIHGCASIVIGVSREDYEGYPDCRNEFIAHIEKSLSLGIYGEEGKIMVVAPLLFLGKKETVELAMSLPGCMEALAYSHTCYMNEFPPCGRCHSCLLRKRGFSVAGIQDPLVSNE